MNSENILFIDTESDETTKALQTIQTLYQGHTHIFSVGDDLNALACMWDTADAVCAWNSPYDLGALSTIPGNTYTWSEQKQGGAKTGAWKFNIFGHIYRVRRIGMHRNLIKGMNRGKKLPSTPVIDLQKLWTILIDEDTASLKANIKKYLHDEPIPYSAENAKTEAYMLQDVIQQKRLFDVFLKKTANIPEIASLGPNGLANIKTPATLTKWAYEAAYPMKEISKAYKALEKGQLATALQRAYHGGITISFKRGIVENGAWIDISGAYATAIIAGNLDRYLTFDVTETSDDTGDNCLFLVRSNFQLYTPKKVKSLKLIHTSKLEPNYVWSDDLKALKNFYPNYEYEIIKGWKFTPTYNTKKSLPAVWKEKKDEEKRLHGKTTRYHFFKFLSNCAYGIKAQREPFPTVHTNMVIAGMITAKVHLILSKIVAVCRKHGYGWYYSDTDSVLSDGGAAALVPEINEAIAPFTVECEGVYKTTKILSLKRYISIDGIVPETGEKAEDKIKLHGRGRYKVSPDELLKYTLKREITKDRQLIYAQFGANTERTFRMFKKQFPMAINAHPFAFETDIPTPTTLSEFLSEWYNHIDTKTTFPENASADSEFMRSFLSFPDITQAQIFFGAYVDDAENACDIYANDYHNWDAEAEEAFNQ